MKSMKMNKSALMFGVLALGGLVALSAPARAGSDDYDHGSAVEQQITPWFFDQTANAQPREVHAVNATQAAVESVTQRRARIAAEAEAKRLQQ